MYFVCPVCNETMALREGSASDTSEIGCSSCGVSSPAKGNLHKLEESVPAPPKLSDADFDSLDGTVFNNVGAIRPGEVPEASYEVRCILKSKDGELRKFRFSTTQITIGRADSDITLADPLVSRRHAEIERVKDQLMLKDLGSTNGTFVNKERVNLHILKESDVVRVGNTAMRIGVAVK